jgi:hypothetical protein
MKKNRPKDRLNLDLDVKKASDFFSIVVAAGKKINVRGDIIGKILSNKIKIKLEKNH